MSVMWTNDCGDHYSTADLTMEWTAIVGTPTVVAKGRFGGNCLELENGERVAKTLSAVSHWVQGFAFRASSAPTSSSTILEVQDAGTDQVTMELNPNLTLSLLRGTTALTGGTTSIAITTNAYHYVEVKLKVSNAVCAGHCQIRINNTLAADVASGQDTQATVNATADGFRLRSEAVDPAYHFDDLYVLDDAGALSGFLGDHRIDTLFARLSGTASAWTPSSAGATGVSMMDTASSPDADVTYMLTSTVGNKIRFFMSALSAAQAASVVAVRLVANARKTDAGTREIQLESLASGVTSTGVSQALIVSYTNYYQIFTSNPGNNASWATSTIDVAEFGAVLGT